MDTDETAVPTQVESLLVRLRDLLLEGSHGGDERFLSLLRDLDEALARSRSGRRVRRKARPRQTTRGAGALPDAGERHALLLELERAARARDEFLDIASHELRTPLTALQLQLQGLERQLATSPRAAELDGSRFAARLVAATRQAERLTELVEGFCDVTHRGSGPLPLQRSRVELSRVALRVCEKFRESASRRGAVLSLDAPHPVHGCWDASRLSRVLSQLVGNALKHAPGAPIALAVWADDDGAHVSVSDQGRGIPPERLAQVFDRDGRAVSSGPCGGLGLGLVVVRRIVDAHGGRIIVESRVGEGARFLVRLPRRCDSALCMGCGTGCAPEGRGLDERRPDTPAPNRRNPERKRSRAG